MIRELKQVFADQFRHFENYIVHKNIAFSEIFTTRYTYALEEG